MDWSLGDSEQSVRPQGKGSGPRWAGRREGGRGQRCPDLAPHSPESPRSSQQPLGEAALELFSQVKNQAASGRNGIWAAVTR